MNYKSLADLNDTIITNLHRLPADIDLVVGIPRSGLLAANLLSLVSNIPLTDLDSFLEGRIYSSGTTKRTKNLHQELSQMRRILILDDSISSGKAMREARKKVSKAGLQAEIIFVAVYGIESSHPDADFVLEKVTLPRIFQWNFMHHIMLEQACVDIDGVLCLDPSKQENDDGKAYRRFLSEAMPLHTTSRKIGWLVTSRLEKYRNLTEDWLKKQGIEYGELIMLDLPSADERRRQGAHGSFKAKFYRNAESTLFVESEERQAEVIARLSGKPVLCVETHQIHLPYPLSSDAVRQKMRNLPTRLKQRSRNTSVRWKIIARNILGERRYNTLKKLVRPQPKF